MHVKIIHKLKARGLSSRAYAQLVKARGLSSRAYAQLVKARGLSSRAYAQPYNNFLLHQHACALCTLEYHSTPLRCNAIKWNILKCIVAFFFTIT